MLRPEIDWGICQACHPCEARLACNTRAIVKIDPDEAPYIDLDRCTGCGECVIACCCEAIVMLNLRIPGVGFLSR